MGQPRCHCVLTSCDGMTTRPKLTTQPWRKERAAAANRSRAADTCKRTATAADYSAHCIKFEKLKIGPGLADVANHVIGCHAIQATRVHHALNDGQLAWNVLLATSHDAI